jgi:RimJ/RimL family protein N-acetyltransferase
VRVGSADFLAAVLRGEHDEASALLGARVPEGWPRAGDSSIGLAMQLESLRRRPGQLPWRVRIIVLRAEQRVAGTIHLKGPPGVAGSVDLGWEVEPDDRGRGVATEAARAVLHWALAQPRVRRVTARIHDENLASVRVAEHLGMRRTAVRYGTEGMIWEIGRRPYTARSG